MGTKFRANAGTQPNAAGLEQIPAGSTRIPQGYLNGIGRKIDRATVRFSGDYLFQALPGGTVLQNVDTDGAAGIDISHPFKVTVVGGSPGKLKVKIAEGRIFGRTEGTVGTFEQPAISLLVANQSLGIPGVEFSFAGGWPNGNPAPDLSGGENPTSQGTQAKEPTKESGGTYHTNTQSGNAGSVTNPGQGNSGIYHNPVTSGNAGSVTNPGRGSSGIYHSDPSTQYNQLYNKSYDGLKNGGGTFVNPPKQ